MCASFWAADMSVFASAADIRCAIGTRNAAPPQAGLEQLAAPDPNDLPNNHLMYAGQWFFFALTALVIYVLALRKRWRGQAEALK